MEKYAIIVAGGEGARMGGALPKQFQDLCGKPVLLWSIRHFLDADPQTKVIVVLNVRYADYWTGFMFDLPDIDLYPHVCLPGGKTRTDSVKEGLALVPDGEDILVAVHDAARPLALPDVIGRGWKAASKHGAAVPVVPVTDSLRKVGVDGNHAVDRNDFVAVQTPQVFRAELLKEAYRLFPEAVFSDDATAVEATGHKISLFPGSTDNLKITNPGDIEVASRLLNNQLTLKTNTAK